MEAATRRVLQGVEYLWLEWLRQGIVHLTGEERKVVAIRRTCMLHTFATTTPEKVSAVGIFQPSRSARTGAAYCLDHRT